MSFVHLHNHTDYSLLDGAGSAAKYVKKAKDLGMTAMGITDHGNMFGVLEFYFACKKEGIQPVIGCEFYICPEGRALRDEEHKKPYHLVLLAMNNKGYHNLMELNSIAWIEGFYNKPRIDRQCLEEHSEGLICLSACLAGEVPQQLLAGNTEKAYKTAMWYKEVFGDRYYIEIQNHFIEEEITVLPLLKKLSKDLDIPLVATNDIHYPSKDDAKAHEILLCIGTNGKLDEENHFRFPTEEFYMKTPQDMEQLFSDVPDALSNTEVIAKRCEFEIEFPNGLLPDIDVPPEYDCAASYITDLAKIGLRRRYPDYGTDEEKARVLDDRLEMELGVIIRMGFEGYFLIVRDYIHWAKTHGIPVGPGRGSGAGSLVAYCIDITDVDPIKYDLLFERFLNPERVSLPDFDIDFSDEGREKVIDYVTKKYGYFRVGRIATFNTLKAKQVVNDVARVLGFDFQESRKITALIPDTISVMKKKELEDGTFEEVPDDVPVTLSLALEKITQLQEFRAMGERYELLFDSALRLEGLCRNMGTHACGIVIGKTDLKNYVPLYIDRETKSIATQYDKNYIEQCGLVKMDFLGLKTLSLLENCQNMIRRKDPDFDLEKIDMEDSETLAMMARGDSTMVFQFESKGMQENLRKLRPTQFEELNAMCSLYRPGPMDFIPQYIASKHDASNIKYPDKDLEELLKPTYGVMVYQEEVMRASQIIAGFTLGQADELRKIMGKKQVKKIPALRRRFIDGAVAMGRDRDHAAEIFRIMEPFGKYGFNKSHSVCYTVLSFRTAYLKCHYPLEFYAANLTNEIGNTKKFREYLDYIRSQKIEILHPDINSSSSYFDVSDGKILFGLAGISGLGEKTVESILKERNENGRYQSFNDFLVRCDDKVLNITALTNLILGGAFDSLGYNRHTLLANLGDALKHAKSVRMDRESSQGFLFGSEMEAITQYRMHEYPEYPLAEKLDKEREVLGFYVSGHPLDAQRQDWKRLVRLDLSKPDRIFAGMSYTAVGIVKSVRAIQTKTGKRMGVVSVEDYNGSIDITLFSEAWAKYEAGIAPGRIMGFRGSFRENNGAMSFSASTVYGDISQMKDTKISNMVIEVIRDEICQNFVKKTKRIIVSNPGSVSVKFAVYRTREQMEMEEQVHHRPILISTERRFNVDASEDLIGKLKELDGVADVYLE